MIGSQRTRTKEGKRLTTAGLIAVTAATLLMMAWAIFPSAAFADGQNTVTWTGNGSSALPCVGGVTQWQLAGFGNIRDTDFTVVTLIVNGVSQGAPDSDTGGTFKWQVPGPGTTTANTSASATYSWTGEEPGNVPNLTISHCTPGTTTTTTRSPTVGPTTVEPTDPTVRPTTVSPGGTAFTGVENVVPLGAIALMLMTSGSGLLWAGSRRRRGHDQDEE